MAPINDTLTEARARHPHLASGSLAPTSTGRLRGVISGSLRTRAPVGSSR